MDSEDRIKAHFRQAAGESASADNLVLSRLRRDAEAAAVAAQRRRRLAVIGGGVATAAAVLVGVLLFTGGDDDRVRVVPPAETSTTPSTSLSTSTTGGRSTLPAQLSALDWDVVEYDLGIPTALERAEQGTWRLTFDRVRLYTDEGVKDSEEFEEEPILVGNTGVETENENTRLRTYRVAANAEVLEIANLRRTCSDLEDREEPQWTRRSLAETAERRIYADYDQVALTFNDVGFVTRIRLATSC